jgi:hypothetical protein
VRYRILDLLVHFCVGLSEALRLKDRVPSKVEWLPPHAAPGPSARPVRQSAAAQQDVRAGGISGAEGGAQSPPGQEQCRPPSDRQTRPAPLPCLPGPHSRLSVRILSGDRLRMRAHASALAPDLLVPALNAKMHCAYADLSG